jgi:multiple sugar transport system ATP-binding protein
VAVVKLQNITKSYGSGEPAVDNVTFTVNDGEFMVLLGPSGCGKSTTLRMIAGLEAISAGSLSIGERVMNAVPAKDRDIAMVFQSYALYPHMKVRDNLAFGLRRRGVAAAEINRRVASVAQTLGLAAFLDRKPFALSGGQRQRVALGRAIVREPAVFLFDEPLSNLDAALRVSTRNELIKLHQRLRATMIYVTHDQAEAMTMGTRICIMNKGRVAQIGAPLDVYRSPADTFVAGFLGNPPMNMLEATVVAGSDGPALQVAGAELRVPHFPALGADAHIGKPVVFGIRPEDVYESTSSRSSGPTAELVATVTAIEPLGAETLLCLNLAGAERDMMMRGGRDCRLRVGDRFRVIFDLAASHVFDAETGKSVAADPAPLTFRRQVTV